MEKYDEIEASVVFFNDGMCGFSVASKEAVAPCDSACRQRMRQFLEGTMDLVWLVSIHCTGFGRARSNANIIERMRFSSFLKRPKMMFS